MCKKDNMNHYLNLTYHPNIYISEQHQHREEKKKLRIEKKEKVYLFSLVIRLVKPMIICFGSM